MQPKRVLLLAKHFQRRALSFIVDAVIAGVCAHARVTIATEPHANALRMVTATDVVEFERDIGIAFTASHTTRVFGRTVAPLPSALSPQRCHLECLWLRIALLPSPMRHG